MNGEIVIMDSTLPPPPTKVHSILLRVAIFSSVVYWFPTREERDRKTPEALQKMAVRGVCAAAAVHYSFLQADWWIRINDRLRPFLGDPAQAPALLKVTIKPKMTAAFVTRYAPNTEGGQNELGRSDDEHISGRNRGPTRSPDQGGDTLRDLGSEGGSCDPMRGVPHQHERRTAQTACIDCAYSKLGECMCECCTATLGCDGYLTTKCCRVAGVKTSTGFVVCTGLDPGDGV